MFCLLEPVYLGFFPYHAEGSVQNTEAEKAGTKPPDLSTGGGVTGKVCSEETVPLTDANRSDGVIDVSNSSANSHTDRTRRITNGRTNGSAVQRHGEQSEFKCVSTDSSQDYVRSSVNGLACESISLHRTVAEALCNIALCTHNRRSIQDRACTPCTKKLSNLFNRTSLQNAVFRRFITDVIRCGHRQPVFTSTTSALVSRLVERRIEGVQRYQQELSMKMDVSTVEYLKRFGRPDVCAVNEPTGERSKMKSLFVFPGRGNVETQLTSTL